MAKLFSYVVRYDDGAAPNPFWEVCTLVICKSEIRRTAAKGDWILGTGGVNSPCGDTTGKVIYAMRITEEPMPMPEYDRHCVANLRRKVPEWGSTDNREKYGDCIYDFSTTPPTIRGHVHDEGNRADDLGGEKALLSTEFYYFGKAAIPLREDLLPLVKGGQGYKWRPNEPFKDEFVRWIRTKKQGVNGEPQMWGDPAIATCGSCRAVEEAEDRAAPPDEGC